MTRHQIVQSEYARFGGKPTEHHFVGGDQVEGRIVVGKGTDHVLEHCLDLRASRFFRLHRPRDA
jgi:hypothetical protein